MRRYFIIVLIVLLAGATYLTDFFIKKNRSSGENLLLKQENQDLRAQIQKLTTFDLQPAAGDYLKAEVFSTYPFNVKNTITVNKGEKDGIKQSMVVTLGENVLLGQVQEVSKNFSVIRTTFDPDWQLPVRIGKDEVNALFKGGNEPKAVLIEKEKEILVNDVVYSASKEFPYGLKIGEVAEVEETAAGIFKEAVLKMPFNVGELREVNVIK